MPDAYNNVYTGEDGGGNPQPMDNPTGAGAAFILPQNTLEQENPLAIIQKNRELAQLQADKLAAQNDKNLQDAGDTGKAWDRDYPLLAPQRDNYLKAYAFEYAHGRDPQSADNPNYNGLQKLKEQTFQNYNVSSQQKAIYDANTKLINDNPDKFDVPGTQALYDQWAKLSPQERAQTPFPNPITNKPSFYDNVTAFTKKLRAYDQFPGIDQNGNPSQVTGFHPEDQSLMAQQFRQAYPESDANIIQPAITAMKINNPEGYQKLQDAADADAKILNARGNPIKITVDDVWTADHIPALTAQSFKTDKPQKDIDLENQLTKSQIAKNYADVNKINNGAGGEGDPIQQAGQDYLEQLGAISKGVEATTKSIPSTQSGQAPLQVQEMDNWNGTQIGEQEVNDKKEPVILTSIIRLPGTGKLMYSTNQSEEDNLDANDKPKSSMGAYIPITDLHQQLGEQRLKAIDAANGGLKVKQAAIKYSKSIGDNWKNGHPDYKRYGEGSANPESKTIPVKSVKRQPGE